METTSNVTFKNDMEREYVLIRNSTLLSTINLVDFASTRNTEIEFFQYLHLNGSFNESIITCSKSHCGSTMSRSTKKKKKKDEKLTLFLLGVEIILRTDQNAHNVL